MVRLVPVPQLAMGPSILHSNLQCADTMHFIRKVEILEGLPQG